MMSGKASEPITGTRFSAESLPVPDCIYLNPMCVKMLEAVVFTTGKTHSEVINTAIENLYYKKNNLQDLFLTEAVDAT